MVEFLRRLGRGAEKFVEYLMYASLAGMVLLVFLNAVLRYVFNEGITQSEELARFLFVWTVYLGAIIAFKENKHVGVDLITSRLKGIPKKVVEFTGYVLILVATGVMLLGGLSFTQLSTNSRGPATGIPFSFITISYVIATVFIIVMTLSKMTSLFIRREGR